MRDAFGGAFMIKLLIIFIVIYLGFTAIALNYAKAFKVKDKVIQYIEDNEISDISKMTAKGKAELSNYVTGTIVEGMNYSINIGYNTCLKAKDRINNCRQAVCEAGIEIDECHVTEGSKKGTYYVVTTAFGWNIPFMNALLRLDNENANDTIAGFWTISGETRTIVNDA